MEWVVGGLELGYVERRLEVDILAILRREMVFAVGLLDRTWRSSLRYSILLGCMERRIP